MHRSEWLTIPPESAHMWSGPGWAQYRDAVRFVASQMFDTWMDHGLTGETTSKQIHRALYECSVTALIRIHFAEEERPHLQVDFEHATVWGTIGELLCYAANKKSFGDILGARLAESPAANAPLQDNARRICACILDTNPIRQKQITRNEYKLLVGNDLVSRAMRSNLTTPRWPVDSGFLDWISDDDSELLRRVLNRTPREFWQDVHNGNVEHAKTVVKNTASRRRAIKRGSRAYLQDQDAGIPTQLTFEFYTPKTNQPAAKE